VYRGHSKIISKIITIIKHTIMSANANLTTSVFERIAALDGTNYRSWAFSMRMLLKAHELWEVIGEDEDTTETTEQLTAEANTSGGSKKEKRKDAKWHKKDQLALSNIALSVKPSEQEHIYNCATAKEAWDCLKDLYEGKGTHRFLSLLKSISTANLGPGKSMKDYVREVRQTADQLAEMGVKLEKTAVVRFILNGLPEHYRYLVVNLESQIQTIGYEDLSARLVDEEKRMVGVGSFGLIDSDPDTVRANMARSTRIYPKTCGQCKEPGHFTRNCPKGVQVRCDWCGMKGHKEEDCRIKEYQAEKCGTPKAYASYAELFDDDPIAPSAVFEPGRW